MSAVEYRISHKIHFEQFIDLLRRSTLAARRPLEAASLIPRARMGFHASRFTCASKTPPPITAARSKRARQS
ncbi:MAG: hypothetical protein HND47_16375 [Chloroflexi bacterium]|nr:hypothetical protein [Chloroflexota bacterium]